MSRFDGTVVLVTGSAERAGAHIALAFAREGATVYLNHFGQRSQADATIAVAAAEGFGERVRAIEADITDAPAAGAMIHRVVELSGRLDVLLHNASTFSPRPFLEATECDFDTSLGVNLRGPFFLSQAAGRVMLEQGGGRILAILGNSLTEVWPEFTPHIVAKTGLGRLMEQLAITLSPAVQCNSIAPTQFFRSDDGVNDALRVARGEDPVFRSTTELKGHVLHETTIDHVVEVLMFLAQAPASVNGITLRMDGGRVLI
jgi:NAD(P)-dependent dehydrogenase (short-subunit alcohol dehydrogenase family)